MGNTKNLNFRNSVLLSGLVSEQDLDFAAGLVRRELSGPPSPLLEIPDDLLANKLVELKELTKYQVEQLQIGRTKFDLGPYIITAHIGTGGMGEVYKAVHEMMGRESAIKVLPLHKATPKSIENFKNEIKMQAQLDHPHLVRAFDAGIDGKVYYLVTEYIPGTDLRRLVRSQGPLTMQQAANIIRQAALGLEYAHQMNLIHRDVKPGNILVTPEGIAKVSDIGLASFLHELEQEPRAGKIVGTADYLSPEQIKTPLDVTQVSDIYSLGCTLYYSATGKVPYPGGTTQNKARRHCDETPWHPRQFNPDINEEFVEIIADMMEKDPAQRIQSAEEVAARLEPWASDAIPIPSQQMFKSPWTSPPLPTGREEEATPDTDDDMMSSDGGSRGLESGSQLSQGTDALASSNQDTSSYFNSKQNSSPPPLILSETPPPEPPGLSRNASVLIALAISIPISMLAGAAISTLMHWLLR